MADDNGEKTRLEIWRELYGAEKDKPTLDQIEVFAQRFGDTKITVLDTEKGTAIFRAPSASEYKRFTAGILTDDPTKKAAAGEILARNVCCYPDKTTFDAWLAEFPAIPSGCLKKITALAGSEVKERGKE